MFANQSRMRSGAADLQARVTDLVFL